jgi:hypothetical protein
MERYAWMWFLNWLCGINTVCVWDCICIPGHIWMCAVCNVYSLSSWGSMWVCTRVWMCVWISALKWKCERASCYLCVWNNVCVCVCFQMCTVQYSPVSNKSWASVQHWHSRTFHKFCCSRGLDKHTHKTHLQTHTHSAGNEHTSIEVCSLKTHKQTWSFSMQHHLHNHCQHTHARTQVLCHRQPPKHSHMRSDCMALQIRLSPGTMYIALLASAILVTCPTVSPLKLFVVVLDGSNAQ